MKTTPRGYPYLEAGDAPALDPYLRQLAEKVDADVQALADALIQAGAAIMYRVLRLSGAGNINAGSFRLPWISNAAGGDPGAPAAGQIGITVSSTGLLTIPAGKAGLYLVSFEQYLGTSVPATIRKGVVEGTVAAGTTIAQLVPTANGPVSAMRLLRLAAGDTLDVIVTAQQSNTYYDSPQSTLVVARLGG